MVVKAITLGAQKKRGGRFISTFGGIWTDSVALWLNM
jgi:hypothetical protein